MKARTVEKCPGSGKLVITASLRVSCPACGKSVKLTSFGKVSHHLPAKAKKAPVPAVIHTDANSAIRHYTGRDPIGPNDDLCRVLVIVSVLPHEASENDCIERALDELRSYGSADIVEDDVVKGSLDELSLEVTRRSRV